MAFNPTREDLAERPPTLENLLRGFHGRRQRGNTTYELRDIDPNVHILLGRSNTIYYASDKRDPNDPYGEGAQGFLKVFYHDQKSPSYFYLIDSSPDSFEQELNALCNSTGLVRRSQSKGLYPQGTLEGKMVELGDFLGVDLSVGRESVKMEFEGYKLFVLRDMRTLVALPVVKGRLGGDKVYMWSSDDTFVCARGIVD